MSPWQLNRLARAIAGGAVIGYPTDTIWGFGCHPLIAASVARILAIKARDPAKGLILLAASAEHCLPYIDIGRVDPDRLAETTGRPTTWLVPASVDCPVWIRGAFETVAVRITSHPLLAALGARLESPLVSTSANRSGRATVRNALQMRRQFAAELDVVVTGYDTGGRRASEIKSLDGRITRSGT